MITKLFEFINKGEPRVGNYVIIKKNDDNIIIDHIGQITYIDKKDGVMPYLIEYDNLFPYYEYGLGNSFTSVYRDEILYWSNSKKELKDEWKKFKTMKKFNL